MIGTPKAMQKLIQILYKGLKKQSFYMVCILLLKDKF